MGARALPRTNAHQHTHTHIHTHTHVRTRAHTRERARARTHTHTQRGKEKTGYNVAGEGVTKRAASGPFGTFCHNVVTKRAGVSKRAGCASNLTRFVTLVTKRAVVTKRAATGSKSGLHGPALKFYKHCAVILFIRQRKIAAKERQLLQVS